MTGCPCTKIPYLFLQGLYLGLAFIAVGAGAIKPCVSAFLGDQFQAGDPRIQGSFLPMPPCTKLSCTE